MAGASSKVRFLPILVRPGRGAGSDAARQARDVAAGAMTPDELDFARGLAEQQMKS